MSRLAVEECVYCGELYPPFERDHVRPRCRGGKDDQLVTACIACNRQKGTMFVHEWMAWRKNHGMTWPPIASHATRKQPEHYSDACGCDGQGPGRPACPETPLLPESMSLTAAGGYLAVYHCPVHRMRYRVGFSAVQGKYFCDCPCIYCAAARAEEEAFS